MKYCFVDRIGGPAIWRLIKPTATALVSAGNDVDYVIFNDGNELAGLVIPEKVNLMNIAVPTKRSRFDPIRQQITFAKQFNNYLADKKPDVVHTNFAVPSIVARWVAAQANVPYIVSTQHELYGSMSLIYRWGLRLTEKYCSAIVYVSKTAALSFGHKVEKVETSVYGLGPSHWVIPNGVEVEKIREAINKSQVKMPGKMVCAGRMVPLKGQNLILQALRAVVPHHPHLKLVLIGSGPDEAKLRRLTHDLGLDKHVEFLGWLPHDQVLREIASAQLVVVPSDQEGFGLVVAETLVCGTKLLVSDIPVFHEILDSYPGRCLFFAKGKIEALAENLEKFFSGDPTFTKPLPALTSAEVSKLSMDKMAQDYLSLYRIMTQRSDL